LILDLDSVSGGGGFVVCHMKERIMKTLLQMLIVEKDEVRVKQMTIKDTEEHENGNLPLLRNGELKNWILALCLST
jgi:hypothetical protein